MEKCHDCAYSRSVPGSTHLQCTFNFVDVSILDQKSPKESFKEFNNHLASIPKIDDYGAANGWANWPIDFDPIWLKDCGKFSTERDENKLADPVATFFSLQMVFKVLDEY